MPELKRCPFCGSQAELKVSPNIFQMQRAYVHCMECGCIGKTVIAGNTVSFNGIPSRYVSLEEAVERAISGWNQRIRPEACKTMINHKIRGGHSDGYRDKGSAVTAH